MARAGRVRDIAGANERGARALAEGDALGALSAVGRAPGALALALRGIAYAQLGDLELAREALDRAAKQTDELRLLARVRAALVEVALGEGDVARAAAEARASADELTRLGDVRNAAMQRLVLARAEVLLGRLGEARRAVADVLAWEIPPDVRAVASLAEAEIAMRALAASGARAALSRARPALERAPNRLLAREVDALEAELSRPVARIESRGTSRDADLFAIEDAASGALFLVDACRRLVLVRRARIPLGRRPVLFTLLVELARATPGSVARDEDDASRVSLLLGDGATWSAQRVSETAGISKRTAQRALGDLVASGRAVRIGSGRNVRYHRPGTPIASRMLLLGLAPDVSREEHGDTP